jgi:hypothetical protein
MASAIRDAHPITHTTRAEALQFRLSATLETQPRNPKESAPRRANKIPEPMEPTFYSGPQIGLTPETSLGPNKFALAGREKPDEDDPTLRREIRRNPGERLCLVGGTASFVRTNSKTVRGSESNIFHASFTLCLRGPSPGPRSSMLRLDNVMPHRTAPCASGGSRREVSSACRAPSLKGAVHASSENNQQQSLGKSMKIVETERANIAPSIAGWGL